MCLGALWELWVQEKNPMPDKIGLDSWLLSPHYDGNHWLLDALYSLYFVTLEILTQSNLRGF